MKGLYNFECEGQKVSRNGQRLRADTIEQARTIKAELYTYGIIVKIIDGYTGSEVK